MLKLYIFLVLIFITSCSKKAPSCSDKEVIKTVIKITKEKITPMLGDDMKNTKITVKNIRTIDLNKETGMYTCKADIGLSIQDKQALDTPISYTSEITDDSSNFYITVYGL